MIHRFTPLLVPMGSASYGQQDSSIQNRDINTACSVFVEGEGIEMLTAQVNSTLVAILQRDHVTAGSSVNPTMGDRFKTGWCID